MTEFVEVLPCAEANKHKTMNKLKIDHNKEIQEAAKQ